jgi:HlyD family secretion protein
MSKKVKLILIGLVVLVAVLGGLKYAGVFGKKEGTKVTAEKVQLRTITEIVNASGKIYPVIEVKVSPDISGEITELTVLEGDSVTKGQIIARIYADIYSIQANQAASGVAQSQAQVANAQAALEAFKAQLDQSEKTYKMQKQLFDDKVISRNEFNLSESNFKSAQANYNAAKQGIKGGQASVQSAQSNLAKANKDLGRTAVLAPMNGVVSLLNVKKGERVVGSNLMSGTEMLRIADMAKIEIRVDVSESDIAKVHLGDSAIVTVDAYSTRKFKGMVTQISSSNNGAASQSALANTSTDVTNYKVYVRLLPESYSDLLDKGSYPFRPGMSASADIQTKTHLNVLSVPINAVTTRDLNDSTTKVAGATKTGTADKAAAGEDDLEVVVFIVDKEGSVKKVKVTTAIQDINYIEISGGLKEGDNVISGPYDVVSKLLKEKDKVKVVEKKDLFEKVTE